MRKGFGDYLASLMMADRSNAQVDTLASINDVNPLYEMSEPFGLGTYPTKETKPRTRKEIYTTWQSMQKDPSLSEGLGLHVTAALGGHESRSDMIFISPVERIRGKGIRAEELRKKLDLRRRYLEPLINKIIVKITTDGVSFGDGFARIYGKDGIGITDIMSNEFTHPPLIQAFEQGGKSIGYHALEEKSWERVITKLTTVQMLRLKMPRVTHVPQYEPVQGIVRAQILKADIQSELPIVPSPVGGSFLYEVEEPWFNVHLALATMNSQQIADAVEQMFVTLNMSGMPPKQQQTYKKGLEKIIESHEKHVRNALMGGEAIWNKKIHVLPAWDEKQILNPLGDITGSRTAPINIEVFMINVRRLMGGIGMDPSLVGWADMLAGGLGDGAAFHTSAQIMRRSYRIRQAVTEFINDLIRLDWAYAYGDWLEPIDYHWQIEFYSDVSAGNTEAITNRQNRMNSLMITGQAVQMIKDLGLPEKQTASLLEKIGGMDLEEAESLANAMVAARNIGESGDNQNQHQPEEEE